MLKFLIKTGKDTKRNTLQWFSHAGNPVCLLRSPVILPLFLFVKYVTFGLLFNGSSYQGH